MPATSGSARSGGVGTGRALVFLTLFVTAVQFLLGTDVNLYDSCFPSGTRYVFSMDPCGTQGVLEAHVTLGVVLGVLALVLLIWAVRRRIPRLVGPVLGGLLGVVLAAAGGYEFLATSTPTVPGDPVDSFLMAFGFLVAIGSYFSAGFVLRDYDRTGGAVRWMPPASSQPP
jgi:hypothetical protein